MSTGRQRRPVLLAAGGTGGHLFPAQALAEELKRRGIGVHLATDARGGRYKGRFPAEDVHVIPSDTIRSKSPLSLARTVWRLGLGGFKSLALLIRLRPCVVVGFGGYPSFPPLFAARFLCVPTILHEQNAVMGRANRMLARHVSAIATSFAKTAMIGGDISGKVTHTGNPVRALVNIAADKSYDEPQPDGEFRLLVFGGSQGARVFSDVVPGAIGRLDKAVIGRLRLVQQVREEDRARVEMYYEKLGVNAEVAAFFEDLPARIAESHLVIARAGASTIAELAAIGRPSILVPLPHALDNDQLMNASALARAQAAWVLSQTQFTPHRLADDLLKLMQMPESLALAAAAARAEGRRDAVAGLADLVQRLAGN